MSWFRKEVAPHGSIVCLACFEAFETKCRRAERSGNVYSVSYLCAGPAHCLSVADPSNHGDIDEDVIRRCRVTTGQRNIELTACAFETFKKRSEPRPVQITRSCK